MSPLLRSCRGFLAAIALVSLSVQLAAAKPRPRAKRKVVRDDAPLHQVLREHRDPLKRESAALLLGLAGNATATDALLAALEKDKSRWVRARAAEALGRIGARKALPALKQALGREREQALRRAIAIALLRLGDRAGLLELSWQLTAGRNHDKAEAMQTLVAATGEPLGQDRKALWRLLTAKGEAPLLARKPGGWLQLRGPSSGAPLLHTPKTPRWSARCVAVLNVGPTRLPLTARRLAATLRRRKAALPGGCLLLLRTDWRRAPRLLRKGVQTASAPTADLQPPGLSLEGLRYLLKRAPKLAGVGIDAPRLDLPGPTQPVRDALVAQKRLALSGVDDLDRIVGRQRRALLVRLGESTPTPLLILVSQ